MIKSPSTTTELHLAQPIRFTDNNVLRCIVAVVVRLREIIERLSNGQACSKDDLIDALQYAARVAENIYVIEIRCVIASSHDLLTSSENKTGF